MLNTSPNILSSNSKRTQNFHFFCLFVRKQRQREQPTTPNKYRKCSRRCFDGQLRTWRRNLHQFDDIPTGGTVDNENNELTTAE